MTSHDRYDAGEVSALMKLSDYARLWRLLASRRNRLAARLFFLVATEEFGQRAREGYVDALRYRAHCQRRRLGFVECREVDPYASAEK